MGNRWTTVGGLGNLETWEDGQTHAASGGKWTAVDSYLSGNTRARDVYHWGTWMVRFESSVTGTGFYLTYLGQGRGSVSDAQGVNQIISGHTDKAGTGYRFRRDSKGGGPRYEGI